MTKAPLTPPARPTRRQRGFEPAFSLMKEPVRRAGESRGFAVARLLTHWAEIAGEEMAKATLPVRVGYGREGLGATLTLLVRGALAPQVEMEKERLRTRVNAVYGYNAIARIVLTQTAPVGFAEGQASFAPAPKPTPAEDPAIAARAAETAAEVRDPALRDALEALARNVLNRRKATQEPDR
jgi:hypothetical protein